MSRVSRKMRAAAPLAVVVCAGPALATVTTGFCVKVGDTVGARTITGLGEPFTDSAGRVGFVMAMNDNTRSIWYSAGEVFNSSAALPDALTGGEDTMGVSDTGGWIYSPSFNTFDSVYTQAGKLLADGDVFPPNPLQFSSFNSRPRMSANGTAWWVGAWSNTMGGATAGRALLKNPTPAVPGATVSVLTGGDVVSGLAVSAQGIGFAYDISDNAGHWVNSATFTGVPTTADTGIIVDGVVVAREGDPTGGGDNWQNWRFVGINNSGNYTICGDTSATADDFVTFNATIAVRQGDVLGGQTLGATVDMVSINNLNQIAMIWDLVSGNEGLFLGDGATLSAATLLLQTTDLIDIDGDTVADYTLTDFNASAIIAPGLDLSDTGLVYVNVDLTPIGGGAVVEAIIGVSRGAPLAVPFCFGDGAGGACPCANFGAPGNGCANSVNAAGGNIAATGTASIAADTIALLGSGMPNSSALYFQGTAQQSGGLGAPFGDGLRCAGGTVVRLKTVTNVAGASQYPQSGDPSVSVRGGVVAPGTRTYQVWYRNAAAFCTVSTFNLTNGVEISWQP